MKKNSKNYLEITDLKDMLNKTKNLYKDNIAYKLRETEGKYRTITHEEVRNTVDYLGTALINMGLKNKRIAIIGENCYEWEIAYLSIVCGTGIVVPFDKSLPENELESVIERSEIEAIFFAGKYQQILEKIKRLGIGKLKHLISLDLTSHNDGIYSQKELIQNGKKLLESGDKSFVSSIINPNEMSIMLFTSGTTSLSKIVALSHKNICTNLMDLYKTLPIDSSDVFLSILPIHHVFECTVGFLSALYSGAQTVFGDGIRYIPENLKEYKVSVMACVPGIYEGVFKIIRKSLEKQGKLNEILKKEEQYKDSTMAERKEAFKEIHDMLGGNIKFLISGAASLDPKIESKYRLLGFNLVQGYGLTETSPVVGIGSNENYRLGSIGKAVPSVEIDLADVNQDGIGELIVKGPSVMLEYYGNKKATKEAIQDGWFYTGDLAKIDEDGYIYICGRKKSVIVLKNGKNIFPEEMENLVNKIEGVKESLIFGKQTTLAKDDIKIFVKIIFDRNIVKDVYKVETDEDIQKVLHEKIKELNKTMPKYKAIRGVLFSEKPLIKTSTNKIKRQANIDEIEKSKN